MIFGNNNCVAKKGGIYIKIYKKFLFIVLIIISVFLISINVNATSNKKYVILGGESIGLQINTKVTITGKFEVKTNDGLKSPWKNSDIEVDDIVKRVNGQSVESINDIQNIISTLKDNEKIELVLLRNNKEIKTSINVFKNSSDKMSLGLYVKDKMLGVGTLTYIDKENKTFASLGHSISSKEEYNFTKISGKIVSSKIDGIRKAIPGTPGEKRAVLDSSEKGSITINNNYGVFGNVTDVDLLNEELIEVGNISGIKKGKASIVTVINNTEKKYYDIEIIELKNQVVPDVKGIKFKVVDEELLKVTGGIIQGMSGSPIVQNGKIIGAVSHVVVDSPEYGYGVYLEWMIKSTQ